jgi:cardiolipin synthase
MLQANVATPVVQHLRAAWRRVGKLVIGFVLGSLVTAGFALARPLWHPGRTDTAYALHIAVPSSGPGLASAVFQTLGVTLQPGHQIALLENGAVFDALIGDIQRARSSVHIVMYIWEAGRASERLSAALIERARHGVACRLVIDDFGSGDFATTVQPALSAAGCEVRLFRPRPVVDLLTRNHRKIAVVDGHVAYTGGFGVRDNWLGDGIHDEAWRDSNVRFTGPAVRDAQQAFAENWQEAGGALLPDTAFPALDTTGPTTAAFVTSTASPVVTRAERLSQLVIAAATRRLWITNAYLVPTHAIFELLLRKARAGVDVRILVPGIKSDSKPALAVQHEEYPDLLAAGIRVWEYAPSMIHSKTMVADDELAVVGSINLDPLSLHTLEESALIIADRSLTAELARQFEADALQAHEITR